METGDLSMAQVDELWAAVPKEPLGYFSRDTESTLSPMEQSDGITVEAFISLVNAIEDLASTEYLQ
jgi:hypothetical protein